MDAIIHIKASFSENYFIGDILLNNEVTKNEKSSPKEKEKNQ